MPPGAVWELHYKQYPLGKQWIRTGPHSTPKVTISNLQPGTNYVMKARGGYIAEGKSVHDTELFQFGVEARLKTHTRKVVPGSAAGGDAAAGRRASESENDAAAGKAAPGGQAPAASSAAVRGDLACARFVLPEPWSGLPPRPSMLCDVKLGHL
jgi:hypothetical protein